VNEPLLKFALTRPGATLPQRATPGSGAFDFYAPEDGGVDSKSIVTIKTGIIHQPVLDEILPGFKLQGICLPRSGLAVKQGIRLFYEGLVDNDYRGEIHISLENCSAYRYEWKAGERLCQVGYMLMYIGGIQLITPEELDVTFRGSGGFGHTGR